MARHAVLVAVACAGLAAAAVQAVAGGEESGGEVCESAERCGQLEDSEASVLLQSSSLRASTESHGFACSTRSLIISQEVGEDTYLQWNAELRASGADPMQFLNTSTSRGKLRFDGDIEFVEKCGKPAFGIVYVRLHTTRDLAEDDALKLKAYLDAGGLLVIGESNPGQVNSLLKDLGSSIRQKRIRRGEGDFPCTTPENAPVVPNKYWGSSLCPLTAGVTGLQGRNTDQVVDEEDSSYPLFHLESNSDLVVARAEKARPLVVLGDDEYVDDECVNDGENNRFAFGVTTNLRFFSNLFKERCRYGH